MALLPTAHTSSGPTALTALSQPGTRGVGPGTLAHCAPCQWRKRGWPSGLPVPTMPTAHASSEEIAATPLRSLLVSGTRGLSTTLQMGVQEGTGVGVKVAPAGEPEGMAAETWAP